MLDIEKKLEILNGLAYDFNWRKRRYQTEDGTYKDQEGEEEYNEYIEKLKMLFVEVALKEMTK